MSDEWETFYGVDDPNGDPDGDGRTNLQEFQEGTNPTNSSSFRLRVIAIVRSGNDIVVTFNGVANKTFLLEHKGAMTEMSWMPLSGVTIQPGATGNAQLTHVDGALTGSGFYRVVLLL
jgi:primosomal replication protein N